MSNEKFPLVFVGHVDHGKSTIIGRLLSETGALPDGKLEAVRNYCKLNSRPFEYAFLTDALKEEQSQGITIDSARVFFSVGNRDFIVVDAPGHIEFLKNMISGAARAEAAFLVIAADEGVCENSRRHAYMLSMLGIGQIVILINKMDLVGYSKERFEKIKSDCLAFLERVGIKPLGFVPVSGTQGANLKDLSDLTPWYRGKTLYRFLETLEAEKPKGKLPFRMFLQDVYKFTEAGDNRRIYAGTVSSGTLKKGDEICFYPSGKKSKIAKIESFNSPEIFSVTAGNAVGFSLEEQIYATRGELLGKIGEKPPLISATFKAELFWLGDEPLSKEREYFIKIGTAKTTLKLKRIIKLVDASSLLTRSGTDVKKFEAAEAVFEAGREIPFDLIGENRETGRFVIVGNYEIRGGGIILESLKDSEKDFSEVTLGEKERRFGQKAAVLVVKNSEILAKELEKELFSRGGLASFFPNLTLKNVNEIKLLLQSGMIAILNSSGDSSFEVGSNLGGIRVLQIEDDSLDKAVETLKESGILF